MLNIFRIIGSTVEWFLRTGIQTCIAKLLTDPNHPDEKGSTTLCAFNTYYPSLWKGIPANRDEKYAGVPKTLQAETGITSFYALSFSSDGRHQSVSVRDYYQYCRWLQTRNKTADECYAYLIDTDIEWRDFITAFKYIFVIWQYLRLECNEDFSKLWVYNEVNIFPLIRRELRIAMSRIPRYLLHSLRVRRFIEKVRPQLFVTHLFEFCYGRAMIYAVKTARERAKIVGVQHGPIAKRKLLYYYYPGEILPYPDEPSNYIHNIPIPDRVILEGEGARACLVEAGYPIERLIVAGAPRLRQLLQVHPRRDIEYKIPASQKVLVVFGQHDGPAILSACIPTMINLENYHFIFKLHPRSASPTEKELETVLNNRELLSTYEIASDSVYKCLNNVDIVLATYSSVGPEAMARGIPCICLLLPNIVNTSPLLDLELPEMLTAAGSRELEFTLRRISDTIDSRPIDHIYIENYIFGNIDASTDHKWVNAIARAADSRY